MSSITIFVYRAVLLRKIHFQFEIHEIYINFWEQKLFTQRLWCTTCRNIYNIKYRFREYRKPCIWKFSVFRLKLKTKWGFFNETPPSCQVIVKKLARNSGWFYGNLEWINKRKVCWQKFTRVLESNMFKEISSV